MLLETHPLVRVLTEEPCPPAWQPYRLQQHDLQRELRPEQAVGWFGQAVPAYRRMRYRSAIDSHAATQPSPSR